MGGEGGGGLWWLQWASPLPLLDIWVGDHAAQGCGGVFRALRDGYDLRIGAVMGGAD